MSAHTKEDAVKAWAVLQGWATALAVHHRPDVDAAHERAEACRVEVELTPEQMYSGAEDGFEPPCLYDVVGAELSDALDLPEDEACELVIMLIDDPDDDDGLSSRDSEPRS